MSARAYVTALLVAALIALGLIAALGLAVDAFAIFGTRLLPAKRFPPATRVTVDGDRVTKAIEIARRKGDALVFVGDSRVQHGFDPDMPALGGIKAYNAASPAAVLKEQLLTLDYVLAHETGVKRLIWGISFEVFPGDIRDSDFPDSGFAGRGLAMGYVRHLFAHDRVLASLAALVEARGAVRAPMKTNGVDIGDTLDRHAGPARFERGLAYSMGELRVPAPVAAFEEAYASFAERLARLKAAGIDVDLVITPMHVWRLEAFRLTGAEPRQEDWKRRLTAMVGGLAKAPGGRVRLFDFASPHPLAEQPVLSPLPSGERYVFYETSHFYPWLGEMIVAKVLNGGDGAPAGMPPFGRELSKVGIDAAIERDRAALTAWEAARPDEVAFLKRLAATK